MKLWAVFGAGGFVGSAIVENLRARGIQLKPITAPRLLTSARTLSGLRQELDDQRSVIEDLASQLAGCDVVINAAGMATPDRGPSNELFGANALLPAVIGCAVSQLGIRRYVHISSQAVQGAVDVLTEDRDVRPFSPYSLSKALGEQLLLSNSNEIECAVILRAVSVHGRSRLTSQQLIAFARSRYASVILDVPVPLTLVENTAEAVVFCGSYVGVDIPSVVLQPGDGLTVRDALHALGAQRVRTIPIWVGRALVTTGRMMGRRSPRLLGLTRRAELLWFGQRYDARWLVEKAFAPPVGIEGWRQLGASVALDTTVKCE